MDLFPCMISNGIDSKQIFSSHIWPMKSIVYGSTRKESILVKFEEKNKNTKKLTLNCKNILISKITNNHIIDHYWRKISSMNNHWQSCVGDDDQMYHYRLLYRNKQLILISIKIINNHIVGNEYASDHLLNYILLFFWKRPHRLCLRLPNCLSHFCTSLQVQNF